MRAVRHSITAYAPTVYIFKSVMSFHDLRISIERKYNGTRPREGVVESFGNLPLHWDQSIHIYLFRASKGSLIGTKGELGRSWRAEEGGDEPVCLMHIDLFSFIKIVIINISM